MNRAIGLAIACGASSLVGCAISEPKPFETRITRVSTTPDKYRFDVFGDPGLELDPSINQLSVPAHEKIRLGMRRYAEVEMANRSLCPHGFDGPEMVLAPERERLHRFFFVQCKS